MCQWNSNLKYDSELIFKASAPDPGRVVINRFLLWVPKLTPKDSKQDEFYDTYMKKIQWTYMAEMYRASLPTQSSGFFQISSSIDNVKTVFVYLQRAKTDNVEMNP